MPRKAKKYHFIYKTTNKINGKYYYGMHSTDNLNDGYIGSGLRLWRSIRKYGRINFVIERLEFFDDRKMLVEKEKEIVNDNLINDPLCMNLMKGGEGGWSHLGNDIIRANWQKALDKIKELNKDPKWVAKKSATLSKTLLDQYKNGDRIPKLPDWNGRRHREETKNKISLKSSIRESGEGNSQYGTKWMSHPLCNKPKKVKPENINLYLSQGWIFGRQNK